MNTKSKAALAIGVCVLTAALALPIFLHFRQPQDPFAEYSCLGRRRIIDGAKAEWARKHHQTTNAIPTWDDLRPYILIKGALPTCPDGGTYTLGPVGEPAKCSYPHSYR